MARIRRALRTISLSLAVVGVTSLASGQQTTKPTNPSPPTRPSAPPRRPQPNYVPRADTPPPHSQANNVPLAKTPPAANSSPPVNHPSPVNAKITPPMKPAYALHASSATPKKLGATAPLDSSASKSVVQQVNTARRSMSGINSKPLPQGKVFVHPNGALTIEGTAGQQYHVRQDGTVAAFEAHGMKTSFRPDGTVSAIHTSNMHINYAVSGARRVETVRPDHSVLVSTGPQQGYLQRTVVVKDRDVVQRIYVVNKATYVRNYTTYRYRGVVLEHYVPAVYYAPAFYGWVYYPWPHHVPYRWGFYGAPWYEYYGGYFTPAPVYPTP